MGKGNLIGLDIGSSLIKVAEFKKKGKGYALKNFGITEVPPESIVEGNIMDAEGLAETIRILFKSNKIKGKNIAISTGGYSVVIKTINVPTTSEDELQKSIRFEAEQYIPYDIDDVNIDFQILGTSEFSPDQMDVLLVAVKKDLVAEYIDLIHLADLNPCIIDVDTFALQNLYEFIHEDHGDDVILLVDVGSSKTSLNILKESSSLLMRDNSFGISQIKKEIISKINCTPLQAEQLLVGTKTDFMTKGELKEICLQVTRKWCSEIISVVDTYKSKSNEGKIDKIVLCGGGSYIEGFIEYLDSKTEAEVSIINPFEGMIIDNNRLSISDLTNIAPLAPIALGLALRKLDDK